VPSEDVKDEDETLLQLAAAQHDLVDLAAVRRSGMTDRQWQRRVKSGEWVPVHPGVWRHTVTPSTWELRVHAAARWLGVDAALAGAPAARWWGLDGFADVDTVEFVVPRARRSIRGLVVHTVLAWEPRDLLWKDGVRLTSATRTVIDMAAHGVTARQLESAIDSGVRLRRTSIPTLKARLTELDRPGRRGIRLLRELLLDSGGESDLERRFLRLMRAHGLPRPTPQVRFNREHGTVMRVDFLFDAAGLVVEVSGRLGHASDADRRRDARRRNEFGERGLQYREFTTVDVVGDPDYVTRVVRTALASSKSH
jgi:very-short-patch-repair endonuclease